MLTLVTAFYDIGRQNWSGYERSIQKYFENAKRVLSLNYPMIIFTTKEFEQQCLNLRKQFDLSYTTIIIKPLNDLLFYDKLSVIENNMKKNIINIPFYDRNCPEFCQPLYILVIFNKVGFMKHSAEINPYNTLYFQWIDFGIHQNMFPDTVLEKGFDNISYNHTIRISGFRNLQQIKSRHIFYNTHESTVSAALFGGSQKSIEQLYILFMKEANKLIDDGLCNQEQYILYYLYCQYPELFTYKLCNGWNDSGISYIST